MSAIGMPRVQTPMSREKERTPPGNYFLTPAKYAVAMSHRECPDIKDYLNVVIEGSSFAFYLTGEKESAPLEADRFTTIREHIDSIFGNGFSSWAITKIFMQTVLVGDAAISCYETLMRTDSPIKIPYGEFLVPVTKLFGTVQDSTKVISELMSGEETQNKSLKFIKLLGCLASTLLYAGQIAVATYFASISAQAQLYLTNITYLSSLYEMVDTEYNQFENDPSYMPPFQQRV